MAGLASPAVFTADEKTGVDLLDLSSHERQRLANRRQRSAERGTGSAWRFNRRALDWGNSVLAEIEAYQLLILDELGPLELRQGGGLFRGLELIDARHDGLACIVVRPFLLDLALKRWPWARPLHLSGTAT
jgi:nucleoside-triphosphatase THEP1